MKVVVTSSGPDLDALANPVFGRCPFFVFVNTETLEFEAVDNPAMSAGGGAGIQAAQFVVEQNAQAVLSGNVGPNAFGVFEAAGVPVFLVGEGSVRQAVEAFQAGRLQPSGDANVQAHAGMGAHSAGPNQRLGAAPLPTTTAGQSTPRHVEIAALRQIAADLRRQLAEVIERINKLQGGAS
jgi:predicted Fe-Mo cluster-binding NifX family protein